MTEHFKDAEFACKCCGKIIVSQDLQNALEWIRKQLGVPMQITSGYRCPARNKHEKGAKNSQHMFGRAADFVVLYPYWREAADACEEAFFQGFLSHVRFYGAGNWIHVDVRGGVRRRP